MTNQKPAWPIINDRIAAALTVLTEGQTIEEMRPWLGKEPTIIILTRLANAGLVNGFDEDDLDRYLSSSWRMVFAGSEHKSIREQLADLLALQKENSADIPLL